MELQSGKVWPWPQIGTHLQNTTVDAVVAAAVATVDAVVETVAAGEVPVAVVERAAAAAAVLGCLVD